MLLFTLEETARAQVTSVTEAAARSEIGRRNDATNATQYFEWESTTKEREVAVEAATSSELSSFNLVVERLLQSAEDIWGGEPKPPVRGRRIVILGSGWGAGSLVKSLGAVAILLSQLEFLVQARQRCTTR